MHRLNCVADYRIPTYFPFGKMGEEQRSSDDCSGDALGDYCTATSYQIPG